MFNKIGISPIISVVLLIAFTVVLFLLVSNWIRGSIVDETTRKSEEKLSKAFSSYDIQVKVRQATKIDSDTIKVSVENVGEKTIEGFKVKIVGTNGVDIVNVEQSISELGVAVKEFDFNPGIGSVVSVEVYPVVGGEVYTTSYGSKELLPVSCLAILAKNPSSSDGNYDIYPNGNKISVYCDMKRDGGGWTLILKTWYTVTLNNVFKQAGAIGTVSDGLTNLGSGYKLSDESIRNIIGPTQRFDILADQSGYNTAYSTGNYEYVILRDYTGYWRFDGAVAASTTTTTFQSYRISDNALAWTGNLQCGYDAGSGVAGINCYDVLSNNPQGGVGCNINMGIASNPGWHHFFMSQYNQDTYLYICNGPQHSSSNRFSHRFWVRES